MTFRLVKHDAKAAYFSGLPFRRIGDTGIEGYIAIRNRADGTEREEKLIYRRVK